MIDEILYHLTPTCHPDWLFAKRDLVNHGQYLNKNKIPREKLGMTGKKKRV
jgi:hypothetical protein